MHPSKPDNKANKWLEESPKTPSVIYGDLQATNALQYFPTAAFGEIERIIVHTILSIPEGGQKLNAQPRPGRPSKSVQIVPVSKNDITMDRREGQTPTSGRANATRTWYPKVRFAF
jgi:hypothetical protein